MSFYCFETRQDRTLAPYPPPEFSQHVEKMSPNEIVDHIIQTNIDPMTLKKIENQIAVPLKQLISPRENRRRRCIPRPQNNFVLYRRNFHAVITKERGHAVAKNFKLISNMAAKNWAEESNEIKQLYELIADCAKKVHDCTYPQYVYQPKHKSSKKGNNNIFREVSVETCKQKTEKSKDKIKLSSSSPPSPPPSSPPPSENKSINNPINTSPINDDNSIGENNGNDSNIINSPRLSSSSSSSPSLLSPNLNHIHNMNLDVVNEDFKLSSSPPPPPSSSPSSSSSSSSSSSNTTLSFPSTPFSYSSSPSINSYINNNNINNNSSNYHTISSPSIKEWRWLNYNQSNTIIPSTNMEIEHQSQSQIQPQFQLPLQTSTTLSSYTELLPPIDIPISSNFLAAYDRSLWDKVNYFSKIK